MVAYSTSSTDPLPSWHQSKTKQSILSFVKQVTDPSNKNYVPPADRIATIDNDGTLWLEQPMYTQETFLFSLIKKKSTAPNMAELLKAGSGMTIAAYQKQVSDWLTNTKNPRFNRRYTDLVYQPMLELLHYLEENNFRVYIVSGGGQDFIRAFAEKTYHIPPERVIGSVLKTRYIDQHNQPELYRLPDVLFISDKTGKPQAINLFIGKKPIFACGNSDGDREMLEWTESNPLPHLMLLIHHDDAEREYAYGPESKIGTFSDALMQEAHQQHWHIVSMKNDWNTIFPSR